MFIGIWRKGEGVRLFVKFEGRRFFFRRRWLGLGGSCRGKIVRVR